MARSSWSCEQLAGWLEGEGSFSSDRAYILYPKLSATSTDLDVITSAAELLSTNVHGPIFRPGRKPAWTLTVSGVKARDWMRQLYPLMGLRRREQIERFLAYEPRRGGLPSRNAMCHADRKHVAKGLCEACYHGQWKRTKRSAA